MNHTTMNFRRPLDDSRNQTYTHHFRAPSSTATPAAALPSFSAATTKMKLKNNGKVIEVMGSAAANNSNAGGALSNLAGKKLTRIQIELDPLNSSFGDLNTTAAQETNALKNKKRSMSKAIGKMTNKYKQKLESNCQE